MRFTKKPSSAIESNLNVGWEVMQYLLMNRGTAVCGQICNPDCSKKFLKIAIRRGWEKCFNKSDRG